MPDMSWAVRHMVGERSILCAPDDVLGVATTFVPTNDVERVTCPRCLKLLERAAEENPSIKIGED